MAKSQTYKGLTDAQVLKSRQKYGVNILTPPPKETMLHKLWKASSHWIAIVLYVLFSISLLATAFVDDSLTCKFIEFNCIFLLSILLILFVGLFGGFRDPLYKILILVFILSIGISAYKYILSSWGLSTFFEPIGILVALFIATGVTFILERSNEKTFQSLNEVNDDTLVKVIRNGNVYQVSKKDVVVGDIVILEAGEEIPADCELLEAVNVIVNESSLTGEIQANKTIDKKHFDKDATYPSNQIFKGTTLIEGYCKARVLNVGDKTESGKVFVAAQVNEGAPTPLAIKLKKLANLISIASYVIAALVIIGRVVVYFITNEGQRLEWLDFTDYLLDTVMIAVTLVVMAVPEGLPMSITLSLAFSMQKLMKENTLPRTMHSCETMGAASVICTDKTGTLTQNQMQVAEVFLKVDQKLAEEMVAVNSTANIDFSNREHPKAIGNPTEGALLLWMNGKGTNYQSIRENVDVVDQLPFTTENKYMATVAMSEVLGKKVLFVKGAPEILLSLSDEEPQVLTRLDELLGEYQKKAMRTLGIAYTYLDENDQPFVGGKMVVKRLKFAGVFAISDPVRKDVPGAIKTCIDAGIQVKIVTGDTMGTAKEIGRQVGLWNDEDAPDEAMTGAEFNSMSDEQLSDVVERLKILSRARPNDKERLVKLLKAKGNVVAVTGDGTNDAPALNAADVGLSMGDGTAVAKEASDMTIQDNSFSTIANAVMWGRSLFKNIQRFVMFQLTINVAACALVLLGSFLGTDTPLNVTQMLWVNLIMDTFAAIALASLPPDKKVMSEKPRKVNDSIISKAMARNIMLIGGLFTAILLIVFIDMQHSAFESVLSLFDFAYGDFGEIDSLEHSIFFTMFVMLQFWNMFNAKAFMTGRPAFEGITKCRGFLLIALVILIGQILIVEIGSDMFRLQPLRLKDWIWIILLTSPVMLIPEILRYLKRHLM